MDNSGDLVYDDGDFIRMSVKAVDFINRLFIFCPAFGKKEGDEENKLLFYFPADAGAERKLRAIGFAEAFCRFTGTFAGTPQPFVEVGTTKDLRLSTEVENGYFVVVECDYKAAADAKYALRGEVICQILRMLYATFRLFFGTFESHVIRGTGAGGGDVIDSSALKKRLLYFCPRYLNFLRLHTWPLMNLIQGVNYMPLDNTNCLRIHSIINRVTEAFPSIRYTMFMCNNRVIWHLTPKSDLVVLFKYLSEFLLPRSLRKEVQPESRRESATNAATYSFSQNGKFIAGSAFPFADRTGGGEFPVDSGTSETTVSSSSLSQDQPQQFWAPKIFIHSKESDGEPEKVEEHYLVVYRMLNSTLIVLVPCSSEPSMENGEFFNRMDASIGESMAELAPNLVEVYTKVQVEEASRFVGFPYLYYNGVNLHIIFTSGEAASLAQAAPLNAGSASTSSNNPPPHELYGVLCDLREEIQSASYFGNVIAKAEGDYWVVAKKAEKREIYALISRKNVTMIEINEEINKLCSQQFENEFLLE